MNSSGNSKDNHVLEELVTKLNSLETKVTKVRINSLTRTHHDVIRDLCECLFKTKNMKELVIEVNQVKHDLKDFGAFSNVGVRIEEGKEENATDKDVEINFNVEESFHLVPGLVPMFYDNESIIISGIKLPNLNGRGETLLFNKYYGTSKISGESLHFTKPFARRGIPKISWALFKEFAEFSPSGYNETDKGSLFQVELTPTPDTVHTFRLSSIWRQLDSSESKIPFGIRDQLGHSLNCSFMHKVIVDRVLHDPIPRSGYRFSYQQELSGIGGNISYTKQEVNFQQFVSFFDNFIAQFNFSGGILTGMGQKESYGIQDKFFIGGPSSVRGFAQRGVGPQEKGYSVGTSGYVSGGLHVYCPLPFFQWPDFISQFVHTQFFINGANTFETQNGVCDLLRHALTTKPRLSVGLGICGLIKRFRVELNVAHPLIYQPCDRLKPGLQFGIGLDFH